MARIRKTDPCPCGSGRKYKYCCGDPSPERIAGSARGRVFLLTTAALAPLAVVFGLSQGPPDAAPAQRVWSEAHGHWHEADTPEPRAVAEGEVATPEGPAPPGKVWSPEHGHWHDAPDAAEPAGPLFDENALADGPLRRPEFKIQRPPGPAPEGKVWDEIHGHWH